MKTKRKNQSSELKSRPEQLSTNTAASEAEPVQTTERPPLPQINFARRRANRELETDRVLALLQKEAPRFYEIAEVIGKWVWIQFKEKQPREVTSALAELGFHWNNKRQAWQHPCGALTQGTENDPRQKYFSYFPADAKAA
jgi:hypothetical protein